MGHVVTVINFVINYVWLYNEVLETPLTSVRVLSKLDLPRRRPLGQFAFESPADK